MKHVHKYILIKQTTMPLGLAYHNYFRCKCGRRKENYEWFDGTKLRLDFYKKQGKDLLKWKMKEEKN